MSPWRVFRAILALPFMVTVVVPLVLIVITRQLSPVRQALSPLKIPLAVAGSILIILGVNLLIRTISLFSHKGRGTLAPWDPTERLVAQGPYRYVRNPMILGVLCILLGESILLRSPPLLIWFLLFLAANLVYIHFVEERGLIERFGESYLDYKSHVPGWIPNMRPWNPEG